MEKKKSTGHVLFTFILYPQTTDSQSLIYVQRVNDKERKKKQPKTPKSKCSKVLLQSRPFSLQYTPNNLCSYLMHLMDDFLAYHIYDRKANFLL